MPTMTKIFALIALVSLVLLFGCTGSSVPQENYDALAASCSKAKADASASLSAEVVKTSSANAKIVTCTSEKQSLESLLTVREQENAALRAEQTVLARARAKTDMIVQYNLTRQYYLEAFGPGKVPNTARLKRIDTQLAVVNDMVLSTLINSVKNCQGITDCDKAKAAVLSYIEKQDQKLALEAAAIVGEKSG